MKLLPRLLVIFVLALGSLRAADSSIDFKPDDTIANILRQQAGQVVELRLTSGEKIGGKVDKVGDTLVHLTQLTGQEFFEAVVDLESVSAVVVRAKSK
jgi:hypothetical protein